MGAESKEVRGGANSFQFPLLSAPSVNILKVGQTTTACPGLGGGETTPQAAPGQLCIYPIVEPGDLTSLTIDIVNRLGFGLAAFFPAADEGNEVSGLWAVTAP
jgi:hypothetical protein